MEQLSFELTPQQKGMLASLLDETGQPVPTLMAAIAAALEELRERERLALPLPRQKHMGEIAAELFGEIPEEELARLPIDGAAQHDHYIYGLPKRSP
jgi:hypothetical protein